jgi:hypothetical protein
LPWLSLYAPSPTMVAYPSGRAAANSCTSAARTRSSSASGAPYADVVGQAHAEDHRILRDDSDLAAERPDRQVANRHSVQADLAPRRVVEPHEHVHQRALTASGESNQRDLHSRLDLQSDVPDDRFAAPIAEADPIESHGPTRTAARAGHRPDLVGGRLDSAVSTTARIIGPRYGASQPAIRVSIFTMKSSCPVRPPLD